MTEISFHFNVPARIDYACRLSRKAQRQGLALAACGPIEVLNEFDRQLWSFAAPEFVPHAWADRCDAVPERLRLGTVWLSVDPLAAPSHDALLNLGPGVPVGFETFSRLYELVSADDEDRLAARARWKAYADRGYAIKRHEVGAP